jgi:hypothetical protein
MADLPAAGGRITPEWLAGGGHFVFGTVHGPLDALTWIAAEGASRARSRKATSCPSGAQVPAGPAERASVRSDTRRGSLLLGDCRGPGPE